MNRCVQHLTNKLNESDERATIVGVLSVESAQAKRNWLNELCHALCSRQLKCEVNETSVFWLFAVTIVVVNRREEIPYFSSPTIWIKVFAASIQYFFSNLMSSVTRPLLSTETFAWRRSSIAKWLWSEYKSRRAKQECHTSKIDETFVSFAQLDTTSYARGFFSTSLLRL